MAKDEGKNLGYHWRRSAGVYDSPDRPAGQAPGNASGSGGSFNGGASITGDARTGSVSLT